MKRTRHQLAILIGLLCLLLLPQASFAAPAAGLEFKIAYTNGRYVVSMRPNATPQSLNITLTSQVTIKVPHGVDGNKFAVGEITNDVDGTEWTLTSRIDAPVEDPAADYLSFTVAFPDGNHRAYAWKEDEAVEVFAFANTGACLTAIELLDNSDPFMAVENSMSTNPGNQIDVMGLDEGNVYLGNYDTGSADCTTPDGKVVQKNFTFLPWVNR